MIRMFQLFFQQLNYNILHFYMSKIVFQRQIFQPWLERLDMQDVSQKVSLSLLRRLVDSTANGWIFKWGARR